MQALTKNVNVAGCKIGQCVHPPFCIYMYAVCTHICLCAISMQHVSAACRHHFCEGLLNC